MSGSASVNVSTIDLSTRVPAFPGVFGAIVIPAKKGPVNRAVLVTSEDDFLRRFTPDEKVEVGFDLAHFSAINFLGKSDKLYVSRAANNPYYAGASFKRSDSLTNNQSLPSDQQLADPSAYAFDSNPDVAEAAERTLISALADLVTPAVAEVTSITTVADTAGSLDGVYFILHDDAGSVAFWIDVDNSGTVEPAHGANRSVEITSINTNDDEFSVAQKVAAAIDGDSNFSASETSNVVTATAALGGARTDASAETSGFVVSVSTQGADAISSLDGKYFIIYDALGSVAFWIDVDNSGTTIPAGAGSAARAIEITTIAQGDDAATVATKIAAAIDADAQFSASSSAEEITVDAASVGPRDDAEAGNSGFTFEVLVQGATLVNNVDELFLIYAANEGAWGNDISIKIINFADDPELVLDNESFVIQVFKGTNVTTPVEEWTVSRIEGKLDGFNRNLYIEEVLLGSSFIRAIDNSAVASNIVPLSQSVALAMGGGDDGQAVTDAEMQLAADAFANPDDILVTVLMDGGRTSVPYQLYLDTIAQSRNDCVAVLSTPFTAEANSDYLNEIIDYRRNQLNLNSSFSALYTPHLSIFDKFNSRNIFVSPDGYAAGAISETAANFEIWFPPAGLKRGLLPVLDVRRRFTKGERDALYNAGINPIKFSPGQGIAIWGQKTLSSRPSALDRLNVRLLLISIQPSIAAALEDFLFDLNDVATRSIIQSRVEAFMDNIQGRRGVTDFKVVCDSSNNSSVDIDNNRLNVDLFIKPTRSVEFINFRTIIAASGDSFEALAQSI